MVRLFRPAGNPEVRRSGNGQTPAGQRLIGRWIVFGNVPRGPPLSAEPSVVTAVRRPGALSSADRIAGVRPASGNEFNASITNNADRPTELLAACLQGLVRISG